MIRTSDPLARAADERPDTVALIGRRQNRRLDYAALDRRVDRLAAGLAGRGVVSGDRVGLLAAHGEGAVTAIHAAWRIGASVVPMDPGLSADRREERIDRVDPAIIVSDGENDAPSTVTVEDLTRAGDERSNRVSPEFNPADEVCVLFTSGTTGGPRAVRLTARNMTASAIASSGRLRSLPEDRWLVPLAPYHMGGFAPVFRAALTGTGLIIAPFDPESVRAAIRADEATVASMVPTMLRRGLEESLPLAALRVLLVGGDRTPPGLVKRSLDADISLHVTYGMTETASQVATATPSELREDPSTVGRPLRGTAIEIDAGEVVVTGPTVSPGYVGEDSDRFPAAGTIRTGDEGVIDAGRLYVTGRIDERIVSGGVAVNPRVIEEIVLEHPGIEAAAVVGVPDEEWGELICAAIVREDDSPDGLDAYLAEALRPAERPRVIRSLSSLPRTSSGTVDREAVRREFDREPGE